MSAPFNELLWDRSDEVFAATANSQHATDLLAWVFEQQAAHEQSLADSIRRTLGGLLSSLSATSSPAALLSALGDSPSVADVPASFADFARAAASPTNPALPDDFRTGASLELYWYALVRDLHARLQAHSESASRLRAESGDLRDIGRRASVSSHSLSKKCSLASRALHSKATAVRQIRKQHARTLKPLQSTAGGFLATRKMSGGAGPSPELERLQDELDLAQAEEFRARNEYHRTVLNSLEALEQSERVRINACREVLSRTTALHKDTLDDLARTVRNVGKAVEGIDADSHCVGLATRHSSNKPCPWVGSATPSVGPMPSPPSPSSSPDMTPVRRTDDHPPVLRLHLHSPSGPPSLHLDIPSPSPRPRGTSAASALLLSSPVVASRSASAAMSSFDVEKHHAEYVYLPWFPETKLGFPVAYHQWRLAALEQLIICSLIKDAELPASARSVSPLLSASNSPSAGAPMSLALIRTQMGLTSSAFTTLEECVRKPSLSLADDTDADLYLSLSYRVRMLETTSPFDLPRRAYREWAERQVAVIHSSALWFGFNRDDIRWTIRRKSNLKTNKALALLSSAVHKLLHAIEERASMAEQFSGVTPDTPQERAQDEASARHFEAALALVRDTLSDLAKSALAAVHIHDDSDASFIGLPYQVTHNLYGCLLSTVHKRDLSRVGTDDDGAPDDDDEMLELTRLHQSWKEIVAEVDVVRRWYQVTDHFQALCLLRLCVDIVDDQASESGEHPLETAAVEDDGIFLVIQRMVDRVMSSQWLERDTHYHRNVLEYCLQHLHLWLQDMFLAQPQVAQIGMRAFVLVHDALTMVHTVDVVDNSGERKALLKPAGKKASHRRGRSRVVTQRTLKQAEFEHAFVRNKKSAFLIQRSVHHMYKRVRDKYPAAKDMRPGPWHEFMADVAERVEMIAVVFSETLSLSHSSGVPEALTRLAQLVKSDTQRYFRAHPSLNSKTAKVLKETHGIVLRFEAHQATWCTSELEKSRLRQALPPLQRLGEKLVTGYFARQSANLAQWRERIVAMDKEWTMMSALSTHSASVVDLFSLLFRLVDGYFALVKSVLPLQLDKSADGLERVISEAVEAYAGDVLRGLDGASLDSLCVRLSNVKFSDEKLEMLAVRCQQGWEQLVSEEPAEHPSKVLHSMSERRLTSVLAPARQALTHSGEQLCERIGHHVVFAEPSIVRALYKPTPAQAAKAVGTLADGPLLNRVDDSMGQLFHMVPESAFSDVSKGVFKATVQAVVRALDGHTVHGADADVVRDDMTCLCELFGEELDPVVVAELCKRVFDLLATAT